MGGLSQSLFGEGSGMTAAQQAAASSGNGNGTTTYYDPGGNNAAGGPSTNATGAQLTTNDLAGSTPSVSGNLFGNAINLANAQTTNYQQMGNQALKTAAPVVSNADAGAVQGRLGQTNQGYLSLESALGQTASGAGPNAGQAAYQQGQDASIANALAAAHQKGGNVATAIGGTAPAMQNAMNAGAAARQGQVAGAQGSLASALGGQSSTNLGTYGANNASAMAQAQMQGQQNALNDQNALAYYGLSQAQEGAAQQDLQQYNTQAINTVNADTAHQQTQNQQFGTELGAALAAGGAAVAAA